MENKWETAYLALEQCSDTTEHRNLEGSELRYFFALMDLTYEIHREYQLEIGPTDWR